MTPTTDNKLTTKRPGAASLCDVCGKGLSTPSSLKRHRAQLHGIGRPESQSDDLVSSSAVPLMSAQAGTEPDAVVTPESTAPVRAAAVKPFYKKKRWYIPAAAFAGLVAIGALSPGQPAHHPKTSAVAKVDPAKAAADKAAADKAAADQAAADKAAAAKAAADQAAADKAAAAKAAAEKAAAAKAAAKAAAEKAAAQKAAAAKAAAEKAAAGTVSQQNAAATAADYLSYTAFSRSGLIKQLEFEGYSAADATWGVDKQHANWYAEAAATAKDYLSYTSFSRSGLIGQLEFDGFTASQAIYGADKVGL